MIQKSQYQQSLHGITSNKNLNIHTAVQTHFPHLEIDSNDSVKFFGYIESGNVTEIMNELSKGSNVAHMFSSNRSTVLHSVIESINLSPSQKLELVKLLVKAGAGVNTSNSFGIYPLHLAVRHNLYDIATFLVENNANPKVLTSDGLNSIHIYTQGNIVDAFEPIPSEKSLEVIGTNVGPNKEDLLRISNNLAITIAERLLNDYSDYIRQVRDNVNEVANNSDATNKIQEDYLTNIKDALVEDPTESFTKTYTDQTNDAIRRMEKTIKNQLNLDTKSKNIGTTDPDEIITNMESELNNYMSQINTNANNFRGSIQPLDIYTNLETIGKKMNLDCYETTQLFVAFILNRYPRLPKGDGIDPDGYIIQQAIDDHDVVNPGGAINLIWNLEVKRYNYDVTYLDKHYDYSAGLSQSFENLQVVNFYKFLNEFFTQILRNNDDVPNPSLFNNPFIDEKVLSVNINYKKLMDKDKINKIVSVPRRRVKNIKKGDPYYPLTVDVNVSNDTNEMQNTPFIFPEQLHYFILETVLPEDSVRIELVDIESRLRHAGAPAYYFLEDKYSYPLTEDNTDVTNLRDSVNDKVANDSSDIILNLLDDGDPFVFYVSELRLYIDEYRYNYILLECFLQSSNEIFNINNLSNDLVPFTLSVFFNMLQNIGQMYKMSKTIKVNTKILSNTINNHITKFATLPYVYLLDQCILRVDDIQSMTVQLDNICKKFYEDSIKLFQTLRTFIELTNNICRTKKNLEYLRSNKANVTDLTFQVDEVFNIELNELDDIPGTLEEYSNLYSIVKSSTGDSLLDIKNKLYQKYFSRVDVDYAPIFYHTLGVVTPIQCNWTAYDKLNKDKIETQTNPRAGYLFGKYNYLWFSRTLGEGPNFSMPVEDPTQNIDAPERGNVNDYMLAKYGREITALIIQKTDYVNSTQGIGSLANLNKDRVIEGVYEDIMETPDPIVIDFQVYLDTTFPDISPDVRRDTLEGLIKKAIANILDGYHSKVINQISTEIIKGQIKTLPLVTTYSDFITEFEPETTYQFDLSESIYKPLFDYFNKLTAPDIENTKRLSYYSPATTTINKQNIGKRLHNRNYLSTSVRKQNLISDTQLLDFLLNIGINANQQNIMWETPIYNSYRLFDAETVGTLLRKGSLINNKKLKNKLGYTAFKYFVKNSIIHCDILNDFFDDQKEKINDIFIHQSVEQQSPLLDYDILSDWLIYLFNSTLLSLTKNYSGLWEFADTKQVLRDLGFSVYDSYKYKLISNKTLDYLRSIRTNPSHINLSDEIKEETTYYSQKRDYYNKQIRELDIEIRELLHQPQNLHIQNIINALQGKVAEFNVQLKVINNELVSNSVLDDNVNIEFNNINTEAIDQLKESIDKIKVDTDANSITFPVEYYEMLFDKVIVTAPPLGMEVEHNDRYLDLSVYTQMWRYTLSLPDDLQKIQLITHKSICSILTYLDVDLSNNLKEIDDLKNIKKLYDEVWSKYLETLLYGEQNYENNIPLRNIIDIIVHITTHIVFKGMYFEIIHSLTTFLYQNYNAQVIDETGNITNKIESRDRLSNITKMVKAILLEKHATPPTTSRTIDERGAILEKYILKVIPEKIVLNVLGLGNDEDTPSTLINNIPSFLVNNRVYPIPSDSKFISELNTNVLPRYTFLLTSLIPQTKMFIDNYSSYILNEGLIIDLLFESKPYLP